jgi:hypothetical protein
MKTPRNPFAHPHSDKGGAHPFKETNDAGLGALASGGGPLGRVGAGTQLAVTASYLRATRCAEDGCGKTRDDPIHFPAD